MTENNDGWNQWRRGLEAQLRRVYDALPPRAKTTYRKGQALESFEQFVRTFDHLLNRAKNQPRVMIGAGPNWELWMHYSAEGRPEGEPLHFEFVSRWNEEGIGEMVERNSLMGYRDIIGETNYPKATVWQSFFGQ